MAAEPLSEQELADWRDEWAYFSAQHPRAMIPRLLATIEKLKASAAPTNSASPGEGEIVKLAQALAIEFDDGGGAKYPDGWEWNHIADFAANFLSAGFRSPPKTERTPGTCEVCELCGAHADNWPNAPGNGRLCNAYEHVEEEKPCPMKGNQP